MEYLALLHNYTYKIQYIPGAKNQVADILRRHPDFRHEHCKVSQCWFTQLVVQDSAEWLQEVTAETTHETGVKR
jgi:hypothetical protein